MAVLVLVNNCCCMSSSAIQSVKCIRWLVKYGHLSWVLQFGVFQTTIQFTEICTDACINSFDNTLLRIYTMVMNKISFLNS